MILSKIHKKNKAVKSKNTQTISKKETKFSREAQLKKIKNFQSKFCYYFIIKRKILNEHI